MTCIDMTCPILVQPVDIMHKKWLMTCVWSDILLRVLANDVSEEKLAWNSASPPGRAYLKASQEMSMI